MVTVAIDAMGGDQAPSEIVKGTLSAIESLPMARFILVGKEEVLERELAPFGGQSERLQLLHAPEVVEMAEVPVEALKKKPASSIGKAVQLVRRGQAHAVVSAGNTGAAVAASYMGFGSLRGVRRPGIAVSFHIHERPVVLMDVGANIRCKPEDLYANAVMASLYAEEVLGVTAPRVGLLNIGEEKGKGNALVQKASDLLHRSPLEFIGNVEGDDIFGGASDVIVCDGFVGNIVLKVSEGLSENVLRVFVEEVVLTTGEGSASAAVRKTLDRFRWRVDYAEQGGAPLLGVNGVCIICHGRSHARAITNALRCAVRMVEKDLNQKIEARLAEKTLLGSEVN